MSHVTIEERFELYPVAWAYLFPLKSLASQSRPPAEALQICDRLGGVLVEMGSAGAKAMAVVRGEADIYPHSGGQYEWDSCAPVAVALAAGLWCSRLDGSPLRYNNADPYLPDLLICRPEMAAVHVASVAELHRQGSIRVIPPDRLAHYRVDGVNFTHVPELDGQLARAARDGLSLAEAGAVWAMPPPRMADFWSVR